MYIQTRVHLSRARAQAEYRCHVNDAAWTLMRYQPFGNLARDEEISFHVDSHNGVPLQT